MDLLVVPLCNVDPLPDTRVDACLVGKVTKRSVVHLYYHRVGSPAIVFSLG